MSTEGYPYHLFHEKHSLLGAYLEGAGSVPVRKLASIFRAVRSRDEIEEALGGLGDRKK